LAANMPGVIYRYHQYPDGSDRFSYVSPGSADLWEYEPEVICADASRAWELIHPDDLEPFGLQSRGHCPRHHLAARISHHHPLGAVKWVQTVAKAEAQPGGSYTWDGVLIDVTDLRQAEAD
jgi:PAS domain-containing protein